MATVLDELERLHKARDEARDKWARAPKGLTYADTCQDEYMRAADDFRNAAGANADSLLAAARALQKAGHVVGSWKEKPYTMSAETLLDLIEKEEEAALAPLLAPAGGLKEVEK